MRGRRSGAIEFDKMAGGGNDFVVIDNRSGAVTDAADLARRVCTRRLSVGADGLILIENSSRARFRMQYLNADGSAADFCANGTRCAARFALLHVIAPRKMTIETGAGVLAAEVVDQQVELSLHGPRNGSRETALQRRDGSTVTGSYLVVGVPHYVILLGRDENLWERSIDAEGRELRLHPDLQPEGANIDWLQVSSRDQIAVRTWERGVEGETLSCGSGVTASAAVAALGGLIDSPVSVMTRSGIPFRVSWQSNENGVITEMKLRGDARLIYRAELTRETLEGFDPEWVRRPGRREPA
ncbi:MAG TPA: diaminopimelate epimerase [Thermoanaerobaculia bacterium]|nr:diaminopimelate epimerase [Thermoanaerobaculia bacterium]